MKEDIAPEVLSFLKMMPDLSSNKKRKQEPFSKEDETRIKVMLNNSTSSQAQDARKALKEYILNQDFDEDIEIADADREKMAEYLRKHAPEFYKVLLEPTP